MDLEKQENSRFENLVFNGDKYFKLTKDLINDKELKFKIATYGCAMNEHDSEHISAIISNLGYSKTQDDDFDLIIFNTCCIRDNAEHKLFGNVGALKTLKANKKNLLIAVCGCMMQQENAAKELKSRFPFVDIIFGTNNIQNLPKMIYDGLNKHKTVEIFDVDGYIVEGLPTVKENDFSAFINITYGCNNFCTYCIVPYVRGRERSRLSTNIINEAKNLVDQGVLQITLLGQNVNSYNNGNDDLSFAQLLKELCKIEGLKRLKFLTSHPKDLSDEVIDVIKDNEIISRSIHLPIQSGSNSVLKGMNRGYTREDYLKLISKIKDKIKDVTVTSDFIVGFPNETEEDFEETIDIIKQVEFESIFAFMYNVRKGTKAEKMTGQIPLDTKHERLSKIQSLQREIAHKMGKEQVGKTHNVLVEKLAKRSGQVCGRSDCGRIINFEGEKELIGTFVKVKITSFHNNSLSGVIVRS